MKQMIAIDCMGYTRKIPVKKQKLKTFHDLFKSLWSTFKNLSVTCSRMDIVFDLYTESSIKSLERDCRSKVKGITTNIYRWISLFLSKCTSFGLCLRIKFLFNRYSSSGLKSARGMTAALSSLVVHRKRMRTCVFRLKTDPILSSDYSSALMKRLMIEINHAVKVAKYHSVAVAFPDTDVFVCTIHHFK